MLAGMLKKGRRLSDGPKRMDRRNRMRRSMKPFIALPIAVFLSLQGYEILCACRSYVLQTKARSHQSLARKLLDRSDQQLESAGRLRACKTRLARMLKKERDPHLDDLYWWVVMRIGLDDEEMARDYELYEEKDAQVQKWSGEARRYKQRASKYGPISHLMKLM
jgi:hypothetical protein